MNYQSLNLTSQMGEETAVSHTVGKTSIRLV